MDAVGGLHVICVDGFMDACEQGSAGDTEVHCHCFGGLEEPVDVCFCKLDSTPADTKAFPYTIANEEVGVED